MTHPEAHKRAPMEPTEGSSTRFPRIQALTLALAGATSPSEVLDVTVDRGIAALGASAGLVLLFAPDTGRLEIERSTGYRDLVRPGYSDAIAREALPPWAAIESDAPVVVDVDTDAATYPEVCATERQLGHGTLVAVPISAGQVPLGALCLSFSADVRITDHDVALFEIVGRHCGAAVDRARLLESEREARSALDQAREQAEVARDRLAFLVGVGRSVLGTLDHTEVLERLLDHAVPRIADAGMALLPGERGLRRVAVAHGNPDVAELGRRHLLGTVVAYDAAAPVAQCFRTGENVVHRDVTADEVADVPSQFRARLVENRLRHWLCVPIRSGADTLGVLALAWTERQPLDDPEHLDVTMELAARAAAGLVNAQLYEAQRDLALALKDSVLPAELPRVAGIDLAARYLPSGGDVGGDWYDALVLADGRVSLTVGDVSGHGLDAGAAMGQLRNAVRAYVLDGHGPAAVLDRVNRLMVHTTDRHVASVVLVVLDPRTGAAEWSCAGHLPSIVIGGAGCRALSERCGPLLGADPDASYADEHLVLGEGAALVLYTDGLVERRDESIDASIARLVATLGEGVEDSADELCVRALAADERTTASDDVCLLVARRT